MIIDYLIFIIAFLITVPILSTFFVFIISKKIVGHPLKSMHIAINWTTMLYIIATMFLLFDMFKQTFVGFFVGISIIALAIMIIVQWKISVEVSLIRVLKIYWRACFLFFLLSYSILVVLGITTRIF